ncbi:MAG: hypothetical protein ACREPA_08985 [Candidatus Dormibacteraceae bacterium]
MSRVLRYRIHRLPPERLQRVHDQVGQLAAGRSWRSGVPWLASDLSTGLFEMEYLRHLREAEGEDISAAGFLKMAGDETDALILLLFMRDASAEYGIRSAVQDEANPIAKLRFLEFRQGRLPSGQTLEEMLTRRPVIKKVMGQAIHFYPPSYRLHSHSPVNAGREWGYALCGLRAKAPSLFEAEQEALKILRGMRHLGG